MTNFTPIFRFVTLHNPQPSTPVGPGIQPATTLVNSLVEVLESNQKQREKIAALNNMLETFIQSKNFFKTKAAIAEAVSSVTSNKPLLSRGGDGPKDEPPDLKQLYETLYDNVVVRTLTRGTANELFKLSCDNLRALHQKLDPQKRSVADKREAKILLPDSLQMTFSLPPSPRPAPVKPDPQHVFAKLNELTEKKRALQQDQKQISEQLTAEQQRVARRQVENGAAEFVRTRGAQAAPENAAINRSQARTIAQPDTAAELVQLEAKAAQIRTAEAQINAQITALSAQAVHAFPDSSYAQVGQQWVEVSRFEESGPATIEGNEIVVHSANCSLKFPFQVADLRVVEQQPVAYVADEIVHIHNTQQGELHERVTTRRTETKTIETLITEEETFREKDNQSSATSTIEKAASEIQAEETSISVNASVSGTYGVVTAGLDAGYSNTQSAQSANSSAQSYAKQIVERAVERVSNRVRSERRRETLEQFEERIKHVIDNSGSNEAQCLVFRRLMKKVNATVRNYGRRLTFRSSVNYPAQDYLVHAITKQPALNLPPDPRGLIINDQHISSYIDRQWYVAWSDRYRTKLDAPPDQKIIVSFVTTGKTGENSEKVQHPLPDGYQAVRATVTRLTIGENTDHGFFAFVNLLIGSSQTGRWIVPTTDCAIGDSVTVNLNKETKFLPLAISSPFSGGYAINIEIECEPTPEAERAWQLKCYEKLIEAYENLKAEAENKMSSWNPESPGLSSARKKALIKNELKKRVLSKMFRCNPFWITDHYEVGKEYEGDCCLDTLNAEKISFIENAFDWDNITYEFYPYLYADKKNWAGFLNLTDDDPHFEAFMQASCATVNIPVHRDPMKETAAVNFIMNNSIANYEVVPASMQPLLDELNSGEPIKFTTGLNGEQLPVPIEVVDLGVFSVPTDLVILECGVGNGIKPIGFPQTEVGATTITIPKQYSPAIVGETCSVAVTSGNGGPNPKDTAVDTSTPVDSPK
jgi:hypothetical protein